MKKIILLALATLIMVGCEQQEAKSKQEQIGYDYSVIIVDGCEYIEKTDEYAIGSRMGTKAGYVAHKGNCRFCAERRKQELKELVEQLNGKVNYGNTKEDLY